MRRDAKRAAYWYPHVRQYKASGMSRKEYCKQHKIKLNRLAYWTVQMAKHGSSAFVPVEVLRPEPPRTTPTAIADVRVVLRDGTMIEARGGDLSALAKMVELLRGRMP